MERRETLLNLKMAELMAIAAALTIVLPAVGNKKADVVDKILAAEAALPPDEADQTAPPSPPVPGDPPSDTPPVDNGPVTPAGSPMGIPEASPQVLFVGGEPGIVAHARTLVADCRARAAGIPDQSNVFARRYIAVADAVDALIELIEERGHLGDPEAPL